MTRYVATGDTYPHRETFTSWAWHWDPARKAWIEDNGSPADWPGILMARDLPGVTIAEENDGESSIGDLINDGETAEENSDDRSG